jgi:acyl carrier protein
MEIKPIILSEFETVAREQGKRLGSLDDETALLDSGLDSLCFAIIVARLEESLGFDPFQLETDREFPMTVGEFVQFYEHAAP